MKRPYLANSLLIAFLLQLWGYSCTSKNSTVSTILIDREYLQQSKSNIEKGDTSFLKALDALIKEADQALLEGPYTVTNKKILAPSEDPHDYASYSRYWWPDRDAPDGLPYIRHDGVTNPDSQSPDKSDRPRIGVFGQHTETLGLAYHLTGELKYAKKAAQLLRVWFLDEATRMNPNLNYSQCRLGHNNGSKTGVLDGRLLVKALEGSLLIAGSSELSKSEMQGLREWVNEYYTWLTTHEMALQEAESKNNHGSYYDAQAMYLALYSNQYEEAKTLANSFLENRVYSQIEPDGTMPEEIARTRPLFYSIYNLHAIFLVAHMAEKVDIDIWEKNNKNPRLKAAVDFLVPYADINKLWAQPTLGNADRTYLFPILKMADRAYPNQNYMLADEKLPIKEITVMRSNLALPLMR